MKKVFATLSAAAVLVSLSYAWGATAGAAADQPLLSHNVYFTLKESTPEARQKLVDSCNKHLSQHPGVLYFATGTLCDEIKGGLNDSEFDVLLLMVFKDHDALHTYAKSAAHQTFITENLASFKKVRVFDADVSRQKVPADAQAAK